MESTDIGREAKVKACGVEGTNQGLVTIYKTFTPDSLHFII